MQKKNLINIKLNIFLFLVFLNNVASAQIDHEIYSSNKCLAHFAYYEKQHQIPQNLLKAVSVTETGIWHEKTKNVIPWPWAINFKGKGYYYKNKKEAINAVNKLLKKGHKSIDIGCMQINLFYHPFAFNNLNEAFEPSKNIAYAASFLKKNYEKHASWHQAVASYHSDNKSLGWPYAKRVVKAWKNMLPAEKIKQITNKQLVNYDQKLYINRKKTHKAPPRVSKIRRKSEIFIKVHQPISNQKNYKMIESIAKNAVNNFNQE